MQRVKWKVLVTSLCMLASLSAAAQEVSRQAGSDSTQRYYGDIFVTTAMEGAEIMLDGKLVEGRTPFTLRKVPVGPHRVAVLKNGLFGEQLVDLKPDDLVKLHILVSQRHTMVKVFSEPPLARVLLDERVVGQTPLKLDSVSMGQHLLQLSREGSYPVTDTVVIDSDRCELSYTLQPAGYLTIKTLPDRARVFLNERPATGLHKVALPPGPVSVRIEAEGYDRFTGTYQILQGRETLIAPSPVYQFGRLKIESTPAPAKVLLNGQLVGVTPFVDQRLNPGRYNLQIQKKGYMSIMEELQVDRNAVINRQFTLIQPKDFKRSRKKQPVKPSVIALNVTRITTAVMTAGFIGASCYYASREREMADLRDGVQRRFDEETIGSGTYITQYDYYDDLWREYQRKKTAAVISSAACGFVCGVSFLF